MNEKNNNLHVSLDEARDEVEKRWNNTELKKKIENELGDKFMSVFADSPKSVVFRQICPADNGFEFFFYSAKYINTEPVAIEYHEDIFTHINDEKKGLGRLRVVLEDGTKAMVDIMDFHANEKKKLGECVLKNGERLTNFHRNLFEASGLSVNFMENSKWFHSFGSAKKYYYYFLLHFVAHGVLFENLSEGDDKQKYFADDIMIPEINRIKEKFGVYPLIVRSYPDKQDEKEDFFWWCYPARINRHIIEFAKKHGLSFKNIAL